MNLFLTLRKRVILYLITVSGLSVSFLSDSQSKVTLLEEESIELLEQYCFDCHDEETKKGNFDLSDLLNDKGHDGSLIFEKLIIYHINCSFLSQNLQKKPCQRIASYDIMCESNWAGNL